MLPIRVRVEWRLAPRIPLARLWPPTGHAHHDVTPELTIDKHGACNISIYREAERFLDEAVATTPKVPHYLVP